MVKEKRRNWNIFISSIFFVVGFSVIFSLLGVLLQSTLASISVTLQTWLARIGGVMIMLFGLYTVGLINIRFLQGEYKLHPTLNFKSSYVTSFVFGAAFAVGWTPCVGPILGAILTLAATNPGSAFFLLLSYTLGLGIPFLLVGFFTDQAKSFIQKSGSWLVIVNKIFGGLLVILGILVFTSQLGAIASFSYATNFLLKLNIGGGLGSSLSLGIAFLAGIVSFLSPCVFPLIPAFLSYLATITTQKK